MEFESPEQQHAFSISSSVIVQEYADYISFSDFVVK